MGKRGKSGASGLPVGRSMAPDVDGGGDVSGAGAFPHDTTDAEAPREGAALSDANGAAAPARAAASKAFGRSHYVVIGTHGAAGAEEESVILRANSLRGAKRWLAANALFIRRLFTRTTILRAKEYAGE